MNSILLLCLTGVVPLTLPLAPAVADVDGDTWTVQNAAQGFAASFSPAGLEIADEGGAWTLSLGFEGWGRGEELELVEPGPVSRENERISFAHGAITEWYVTDERGVEQGFTVAAPPPVARPDESRPLRLRLAVEGGFAAEVLPGGRDVRFAGRDEGVHVFYTGLCAWDSRGRELDASFEAGAGKLSILVDDRGAAYPLTIDPWLWTQKVKLTASDAQSGDLFGNAVAIDGDTYVIGARNADGVALAEGAAYVFLRTGTVWSEQAKLFASDGQPWDRLGWSVAIDVDTAVVGAPDAYNSYIDDGSAYVFTRTGTTWGQQAKLIPNDPEDKDNFGWAVAIDGDTAIVGAYRKDEVGTYSGAAYVFVRSGTSWNQQAKLVSNDLAAFDNFGAAVALEGNTAVIGAFRDDDWGASSGSAYVFMRAGTVWSQQSKLIASDGSAGHNFGTSVSLHGDSTLIGAVFANAAYVFTRSGTNWNQQAKLTGSGITVGEDFGISVSLDEDRALVGAWRDDSMALFSGSAFVFERVGTTWSEESRITASDGAGYDHFGCAVALAGGTALVGSYEDDDAGTSSGAAYVFESQAVASATLRNAGSNPVSYVAATLPVLGTTYTAVVNLGATTGHAMAWLVGFATPLTVTLGSGQVILVNFADPGGELLLQPFVSGPIAYFNLPVPNDASLAGFELSTQAAHIGGVMPFALSNAQDLFVGY